MHPKPDPGKTGPDKPGPPGTFRKTLPGLLGGMAAMLAAVGALVAALGAAGLFGLPRTRTTPPARVSEPALPPAVSTRGDANPASTATGDDVTIRSGD